MSSSVYCEVIDLDHGNINLLTNYQNERTGTKDSEMGKFVRDDGKFVINYDIGAMAGIHMHQGKKDECIWYSQQFLGSYNNHHRFLYAGIMEKNGKKQMIISLNEVISNTLTISNDEVDAFTFPANFWADITNENDVAELLLIAISYNPKSN